MGDSRTAAGTAPRALVVGDANPDLVLTGDVVPTWLASVVGQDLLGDDVLARLDARGVRTDHVRAAAHGPRDCRACWTVGRTARS